MSLSQFEPIHGLLPYTIKAGFFANVNHFSTLLLMSIPPIVLAFERGQRLLPVVALVVVLLLLLAAGSIAGIMIGFSITALSLLLLTPVRLTRTAMVAGTIAVAAAFAFGAWRHVSAETFDAPFGRLDFLKTALLAIKDSPVFGTGYGTFVQTYQIYELPNDIYSEYVNHAHNEYAELLMEGGIVAALLIAIYALFLGWGMLERRDHATARAAFLCILVVLVHSLVDYPLRTMAIMSCFIFAHAMIFTQHVTPRRASAAGQPGLDGAADAALPVSQGDIRPERFRETEQLREEIDRLMSQRDR
jgi:O-antigen ligase